MQPIRQGPPQGSRAVHAVPGTRKAARRAGVEPSQNSGRLDYLVAWTQDAPGGRTRHRDISDRIEQEIHTPGARLTNRRSNAIHAAFTGTQKGDPRPANPAEYAA
jgi:hypothetical protein